MKLMDRTLDQPLLIAAPRANPTTLGAAHFWINNDAKSLMSLVVQSIYIHHQDRHTQDTVCLIYIIYINMVCVYIYRSEELLFRGWPLVSGTLQWRQSALRRRSFKLLSYDAQCLAASSWLPRPRGWIHFPLHPRKWYIKERKRDFIYSHFVIGGYIQRWL